MKKQPSLFLKATSKYTSMSQDLSKTKKEFLREMTFAQLNQAVAPEGASDKPVQVKPVNLSQPSDPNGKNKQDSAKQTDPKNTKSTDTPLYTVLADTKLEKQGAISFFYNADGFPVTVGDTGKENITSADFNELQKAAKAQAQILSKYQKTNEEVVKDSPEIAKNGPLDFLEVLSKGGNAPALLSKGPAEIVAPAGDVLLDMDGGEEVSKTKDGTTEVGKQEVDKEAVETGSYDTNSYEAGNAGANPSTAPKAEPKATSSNSPKELDTESEQPTSAPMAATAATGGDSSMGGFTSGPSTSVGEESDSDDAEKKEVSPEEEPTALGKEASPAPGKEVAQAPEQDEAPETSEEAEVNPSGKESAFWVPDNDLLGLSDIISTGAKKNGVPDSQVDIVKDANGNLAKKPMGHMAPNMRQYVRTSAAPGMPMTAQSAVLMPDLDSVMGLDPTTDKALNISLNFNF